MENVTRRANENKKIGQVNIEILIDFYGTAFVLGNFMLMLGTFIFMYLSISFIKVFSTQLHNKYYYLQIICSQFYCF